MNTTLCPAHVRSPEAPGLPESPKTLMLGPTSGLPKDPFLNLVSERMLGSERISLLMTQE